MNSPLDRAIQFCESLFGGPSSQEKTLPPADDADAESAHTWAPLESLPKSKFKSMTAPLMPQEQKQRKEPTCQLTKDGRCVSNISSSGKKVLMFDEKTFQFKLTDPL